MNLIKQFPDISEKMRAKIRMEQRVYRVTNAMQPLTYIEDKAVVKYYEGEFKRWHFKLFFIVAASIGGVYFVLLKSSWILNWLAA
jgi:hypothetical protein